MEKVVYWWCDHIGVTDQTAIQTAVGVVAGLSLVFAVLIAFGLLMGLLNWMSRQP